MSVDLPATPVRGSQCAGKRPLEWCIAFPIIRAGIGHNALHWSPGIVTRLAGQLSSVPFWNKDGFAVGIQEHILRVKTQTSLRFVWAIDPITINLSGFETREEDASVMIALVPFGIAANHPHRSSITGMVKQEQLHGAGIL